MHRHGLRILLSVIIVAIVLAGGMIRPGAKEKAPMIWLNQTPPNFTLTDVGGKKVTLSQFRNKKTVVVAFWMPNAPASIPQLKELKKIVSDKTIAKKVKVLAITFAKEQTERDAAKKKFKDEKLNFTILFEKREDLSNVAAQFMVRGLPAFYVVNKKGKLATAAVNEVNGKVGGTPFKTVLKNIVNGKTIAGCSFKPEPNKDPQYKAVYGLVGKAAPEISAKDLSGKAQTLSSHEGKNNVVLVFWMPGCGHCRFELPQLKEYADKWGGKQKVKFITVNIDDRPDSKAAIKTFTDNFDIDFPVINDDGKIGGKYGVHSVPTLILVDKKGIIREAFVGEFSLPADVLHCEFGKMN